MPDIPKSLRSIIGMLVVGTAMPVMAGEVSVAVAANFTAPLKEIASRFERESGHKVVASSGATGQFYAQIRNGSPFEVLLAADETVPVKLEQEGYAVPATRFTYAIGKLVLWSATAGLVDDRGAVLGLGKFDHLAIANPVTAPYGLAAVQTLKALGEYERVAPKFVQGASITQTFQFIQTGNAPLGFVALSQVFENGKLQSGSAWIVPTKLHAPIRQQVVVLSKGRNNPAALAFVSYLKGKSARDVMRDYGYDFE
ncbi:MAG: molybdate ABC transporter substrate-binding protein [Herminiimonas sp.]|nr:molybdate ABC transporter substrate-binding protein [Herminiimonas sp.]